MSSEQPPTPEHTNTGSKVHAGAKAATSNAQDKPKKSLSIIILGVILVILLCIAGGGIGYIAWMEYELNQAKEEIENTPEPSIPTVEPEVEAEDEQPEPEAEEESVPEEEEEEETVVLVENPIDFETLQAENPDIYAWIYIPGTDVNLPILQSSTDDSFYLDHNRYGDYAVEGSIYTQLANATDFSDPVTVIYGHNMANGTMFTTIHYFENASFFEEYNLIYIYTVDRILTYQVISAYQYDNRHILNSFDFTDEGVLQSYFDYVVDPDSILVNTADDITLTTDDKIIQLSTCSTGTYNGTTRYLVTGVLIDEQATY